MTYETKYVGAELFQWLNEQADLNSSTIDLVDGFVFMLRKIERHQFIRLIGPGEIHPRFWRSHDRTFGYNLMEKNKYQRDAHLYQFYMDVAYNEKFVYEKKDQIMITEKGKQYLQRSRDDQLSVLFAHMW